MRGEGAGRGRRRTVPLDWLPGSGLGSRCAPRQRIFGCAAAVLAAALTMLLALAVLSPARSRAGGPFPRFDWGPAFQATLLFGAALDDGFAPLHNPAAVVACGERGRQIALQQRKPFAVPVTAVAWCGGTKPSPATSSPRSPSLRSSSLSTAAGGHLLLRQTPAGLGFDYNTYVLAWTGGIALPIGSGQAAGTARSAGFGEAAEFGGAAGAREVPGSGGASESVEAAGSRQAVGARGVAGSGGASGSVEAAGSREAVGPRGVAGSGGVPGSGEASGSVEAAGSREAVGARGVVGSGEVLGSGGVVASKAEAVAGDAGFGSGDVAGAAGSRGAGGITHAATVRLGVTPKLLFVSIKGTEGGYDDDGFGYGLDAGVGLDMPPRASGNAFSFSLAALDVVGRMQYARGAEEPAAEPTYVFSAVDSGPRYTIGVAARIDPDSVRWSAGGEYVLSFGSEWGGAGSEDVGNRLRIALRAGFDFGNAGPEAGTGGPISALEPELGGSSSGSAVFGFGIAIRNFAVDYAFTRERGAFGDDGMHAIATRIYF